MGPCVSVLLPHAPSDADAERITDTIGLLCERPCAWGALDVVTTELIGGRFHAARGGESRPFGINLSAFDSADAEEISALKAGLGIEPFARIDAYETISGTTAMALYGDADFLRRWLASSAFFLIK